MTMVLMLGATMSAAAGATPQRPAVDWEYRHDPRWALGNSLDHAHLSKQFRKRILLDLTGDATGKDMDANFAAYTMVYGYTIPATANGPARHVLRVWGGGGSCSTHGVCTILIYDARTGLKLLEQSGWDFQFSAAIHAGAHDVVVMDKTSQYEMSKRVLRYNGRRYVVVKDEPMK